ncbi:hypothetical protein U9M48_042694 [Paspalum notatum var. saurae]|uniref:Reverse transcriptase zinc-binding domain-containing protein n=1 Tax=Paspalum notatum var. saurae TaxID=547442 RepID=A0AAQ3URC7_PASNO
MKIKPIFLNGEVYKVNNGSQVRFCEDKWLGNIPSNEQYQVLYNIVHRKHDTVATVMSTSPLNVSIRRALVGNKLQPWHDLVGKITNITLNDQPDQFRWLLTKNGLFTVQSMYKQLIICMAAEIPLKIKVFIWLLLSGVILTKDNLILRRWQDCKQYFIQSNTLDKILDAVTKVGVRFCAKGMLERDLRYNQKTQNE